MGGNGGVKADSLSTSWNQSISDKDSRCLPMFLQFMQQLDLVLRGDQALFKRPSSMLPSVIHR
jgi:hypothetical protein